MMGCSGVGLVRSLPVLGGRGFVTGWLFGVANVTIAGFALSALSTMMSFTTLLLSAHRLLVTHGSDSSVHYYQIGSRLAHHI